jgi:predicted PurR-regulated permease PerM
MGSAKENNPPSSSMSGTNLARPASLALFLIIITVGIYAVVQAKDFLYPLAFGTLFSYLLFPPANFLEKKGFPRILAIIIVLLGALFIIAVIFFLFYRQLQGLLNNFDSLKTNAGKNIELLQNQISNWFGIKDNGLEIFLKKQVDQFFGGDMNGVGKAFTATTGTVFRIIILPIYVFLLLYYRTKFAYFILKLVDRKSKPTAVKILRDISHVAARYMGGVTIVVLILATINSTGLAIIGVQYAILLGIVSALFNYIPYFGTLMGGAVPFLFVLLSTSDPGYYGLRVALLFMVVQFTENYILTPNIVGGNVRINPLVIIVGLVAGGMIWGIPGLLVIIPFLAILKIIFMHIPSLNPYAYLLGIKGTRKHSIHLGGLLKKLHLRK